MDQQQVDAALLHLTLDPLDPAAKLCRRERLPMPGHGACRPSLLRGRCSHFRNMDVNRKLIHIMGIIVDLGRAEVRTRIMTIALSLARHACGTAGLTPTARKAALRAVFDLVTCALAGRRTSGGMAALKAAPASW